MRTHETAAERDPALEGLAMGRIVLGAASLAAPSALAGRSVSNPARN